MSKKDADQNSSRAFHGSLERFLTTWTSSTESLAMEATEGMEQLQDGNMKENDPMEDVRKEPFTVLEVGQCGVVFWEPSPRGLVPSRPLRPSGWRNAVPGQRLPVQIINEYSYRLLPLD